MWHVSSRSGVATLRTAVHLLLTYMYRLIQIPTVWPLEQGIAPVAARRYALPPTMAVRRCHIVSPPFRPSVIYMYVKIAADLRPFTDRSVVGTSLMAGGG